MIINFHQWQLNFKIILFVFVCVFFILCSTFIFIAPPYEKLRSLQKGKIILDQNWQKHHQEQMHHQELLRNIVLLQYPYIKRLTSLRRPMSPEALYAQIGFLAKSHLLKILELKPQKHQSIANLEQQIFNLKLSGDELNLLSFFRLLMHQSWLSEIQTLELTPINRSVHLQATLAAYYYDAHE